MSDDYETALRGCLHDVQIMLANELEGMRTGRYRGPNMRDCIGQWVSLERDIRNLLNREDNSYWKKP